MWVVQGDEKVWKSDKPFIPYDFHKDKTPEEKFRKQVLEMDSKTNMNKRLDENELRQRRKLRNGEN